ncbi:MAG: protein kinase [Deltaproteobacteria bacterium]|nr:protein kinase [Deltaproteobacteria bacterium]
MTTPLPPRGDEIIGRKAGTYLIDRLIGEGGMGAVYVGTCQLAGGKRAAIKVMHAEYTENREAADRFGREATTAAAVSDLNVLDIYGADRFAEDGRMFIVMPYVEGGSLEDLCRRVGPLPVEKMIPIMLQVCSGLDAVHAVGVIHRDVKTQNILVTRKFGREHHAYVVDFGIAKLLTTYLAGDRNRLTRTRATLGTPGCMAPEQARGDADVDARADVYSVGMVMYRVLLGRMPYDAPTMYAMLEAQAMRTPFPRPRELRPELPRIVDELIMSCLEHERRQRPASMLSVAQILARVSPAAQRQFEVLASGLATRQRAAPQAATVASGIETAIARSIIDARPEAGRHRVARVAVPLAIGVALGAGGFALAKIASDRSSPSGATTPLAGTAPDVPADARQPVSAVIADASVPMDAPEATAGAPADAPPDATELTVVRADAGVLRRADRSPPAPIPVSGSGTLVVRKPPRTFLEVFVGGNRLCETPCREPLDAGTFSVLLKGGGKEETVTVKIIPGRETTIQRNNW